MDAAALRAMQAPHKESYKQDPAAALITLKAQGEIDDAKIACKVETGRALAVAGLHPATGGSGAELCSGDTLLKLTERYCVVFQTLNTKPELSVEMRGA